MPIQKLGYLRWVTLLKLGFVYTFQAMGRGLNAEDDVATPVVRESRHRTTIFRKAAKIERFLEFQLRILAILQNLLRVIP